MMSMVAVKMGVPSLKALFCIAGPDTGIRHMEPKSISTTPTKLYHNDHIQEWQQLSFGQAAKVILSTCSGIELTI